MKRAISDQAKDVRREAILMAALEEFYINGFKATKMDAIAERANISKGALYLYFKSKEAIFEQLIVSIALPKMELIESAIKKSDGVEQGLNRLLTSMPYLIRHSPMPKVIKVLLSDAFAFPALVEFYRQNIINRGLHALSHLLAKGKQQGEIEIDDPEMTARLVVSPVIMSVIWTVVFESTNRETQIDLDAFFAQHKVILFRGLGIKKESLS